MRGGGPGVLHPGVRGDPRRVLQAAQQRARRQARPRVRLRSHRRVQKAEPGAV